MKINRLRVITSFAILSLLLSMSPVQARPNPSLIETHYQETESSGDPDLPEGLTSSEWQNIQNQIMSNPSQQVYLKASNTDAYDYFGRSVAVSNNTVVVGAYSEDSAATGVNGDQNDNSAGVAGAAYVFVRDGTTWTQQAYLKASNTDAGDVFGRSIAVSNDTIVIGARSEDSAATGINGDQDDDSASMSGAAYVFVRDGTTWTQQAYLKASNTDAGDEFGISVAVSNDTIVVGAQYEASAATGVNGDQNDNSASGSGAAYVFVRDGTTWTQQAYLKASNTDANDHFGNSVAVSNDTIVVDAWGEDSAATGVNGNQNDNSADAAGAAYVFVRDGTTWTQQAYIKASNTGAGDWFGGSVAVSDDTIVVGAQYEESAATGVNGDQNDNSASCSGAAYVFVRDGTTWTQQAYLKASNTDAHDEFGVSVAVSNDTVVVGALYEDSVATGVNGDQNDNSASSAGAAYVFVRDSTTWTQQAYLKASNTDAGDFFSTSVAVSNDTIVVDAWGEDSAATGVNGNQNDNSADAAGAAYVFFNESSPPPTSYQQKYLFVPLNWNGSQSGFESAATSQIDFFINEIPLSSCRDQVLVDFLDVESENFANFSCTDNPLRDIRNFVTDQTDYSPDDFDVVIGLTEASPCPPTAGQSNGANTIWVTTSSIIVTAHELGHIFGLEDQYCSNQAGSNDDRCNDGDIQNDGPLTGDINWLSPFLPFNCPPDGSNDSTGVKCCNYDSNHICSSEDYGVCCHGNLNSSGGRSTMSYANAPGTRGFDDIELAYLDSIPELQCKSSYILSGGVTPQTDSQGNTWILNINLMVQSDDSVESLGVTIDYGRPTQDSVLANLSGDYHLLIFDKDGLEIFQQTFSLYFDYTGPVFDEVDYSAIGYTEQDFSIRLPYARPMNTLVLYHGGEEIFSQQLPTISDIFLPVIRK